MKETLLPAAVIALSAGAGVVYLLCGDWRHALYWLAAAVVNLAATL
jgi:hypothetical protein